MAERLALTDVGGLTEIFMIEGSPPGIDASSDLAGYYDYDTVTHQEPEDDTGGTRGLLIFPSGKDAEAYVAGMDEPSRFKVVCGDVGSLLDQSEYEGWDQAWVFRGNPRPGAKPRYERIMLVDRDADAPQPPAAYEPTQPGHVWILEERTAAAFQWARWGDPETRGKDGPLVFESPEHAVAFRGRIAAFDRELLEAGDDEALDRDDPRGCDVRRHRPVQTPAASVAYLCEQMGWSHVWTVVGDVAAGPVQYVGVAVDRFLDRAGRPTGAAPAKKKSKKATSKKAKRIVTAKRTKTAAKKAVKKPVKRRTGQNVKTAATRPKAKPRPGKLRRK